MLIPYISWQTNCLMARPWSFDFFFSNLCILNLTNIEPSILTGCRFAYHTSPPAESLITIACRVDIVFWNFSLHCIWQTQLGLDTIIVKISKNMSSLHTNAAFYVTGILQNQNLRCIISWKHQRKILNGISWSQWKVFFSLLFYLCEPIYTRDRLNHNRVLSFHSLCPLLSKPNN